jgi:hypothetical protein
VDGVGDVGGGGDAAGRYAGGGLGELGRLDVGAELVVRAAGT